MKKLNQLYNFIIIMIYNLVFAIKIKEIFYYKMPKICLLVVIKLNIYLSIII